MDSSSQNVVGFQRVHVERIILTTFYQPKRKGAILSRGACGGPSLQKLYPSLQTQHQCSLFCKDFSDPPKTIYNWFLPLRWSTWYERNAYAYFIPLHSLGLPSSFKAMSSSYSSSSINSPLTSAIIYLKIEWTQEQTSKGGKSSNDNPSLPHFMLRCGWFGKNTKLKWRPLQEQLREWICLF